MNIARLFTQSAAVQTYLGSSGTGDKYATALTVPCFVNDGHERTIATVGVELVSHTTLYAPIDSFDAFKPGSKVTVNGRTAKVVSVFRRDSAGPAAAHHTQANLI